MIISITQIMDKHRAKNYSKINENPTKDVLNYIISDFIPKKVKVSQLTQSLQFTKYKNSYINI